jgi:hypothetical protein
MNKIGPNIKPPGFGNSSASINKKGESATNATKKTGKWPNDPTRPSHERPVNNSVFKDWDKVLDLFLSNTRYSQMHSGLINLGSNLAQFEENQLMLGEHIVYRRLNNNADNTCTETYSGNEDIDDIVRIALLMAKLEKTLGNRNIRRDVIPETIKTLGQLVELTQSEAFIKFNLADSLGIDIIDYTHAKLAEQPPLEQYQKFYKELQTHTKKLINSFEKKSGIKALSATEEKKPSKLQRDLKTFIENTINTNKSDEPVNDQVSKFNLQANLEAGIVGFIENLGQSISNYENFQAPKKKVELGEQRMSKQNIKEQILDNLNNFSEFIISQLQESEQFLNKLNFCENKENHFNLAAGRMITGYSYRILLAINSLKGGSEKDKYQDKLGKIFDLASKNFDKDLNKIIGNVCEKNSIRKDFIPPFKFLNIRNLVDGFKFTKEKMGAIRLILQDKSPSSEELNTLPKSQDLEHHSSITEINQLKTNYSNEIGIGAVAEGRVSRALMQLLAEDKLKFVIQAENFGPLDTKLHADFLLVDNANRLIPLQVKSSVDSAKATAPKLPNHLVISPSGLNIFSEPKLSDYLLERIGKIILPPEFKLKAQKVEYIFGKLNTLQNENPHHVHTPNFIHDLDEEQETKLVNHFKTFIESLITIK